MISGRFRYLAFFFLLSLACCKSLSPDDTSGQNSLPPSITDTGDKQSAYNTVTYSQDDIELIRLYKKEIQEEEKNYELSYQDWLTIKNEIQNTKHTVKLEEEEFFNYKTLYQKKKIQEREERVRRLYSQDPERNAFWRKEAARKFSEELILSVDENKTYYLCEVRDPVPYYHPSRFSCEKLLQKITYESLKNRNFFEEVSIHEILPRRSTFFVIFVEDKKNLSPLYIRDDKDTPYLLSFAEYNGNLVLKLHLVFIDSKNKKFQYYLLSPLDIVFKNRF